MTIPATLLNTVTHDECVRGMAQLPDACVDVVITDPPYGVDYADDHYDDRASTVFTLYLTWLQEIARVLKDGSHCYIFVPTLELDKWIGGVKQVLTFNNVIATQVYITNNGASIHNNFTFDFQPVIFASKGKARDFNQVNWIPMSDDWKRDSRNIDRRRQWTYQYPSFLDMRIARSNTKPNGFVKRIHPNEKNPDLIAKWIAMSTQPNAIVLDPFCGSGSTSIAAIQTQRQFITFEQNAEYYTAANIRVISAQNTVAQAAKQRHLDQFVKHTQTPPT